MLRFTKFNDDDDDSHVFSPFAELGRNNMADKIHESPACSRGFIHNPYAFATRQVKTSEYAGHEDAMAAYWKECKNLEAQATWRWEAVSEWSDVQREAKTTGTDIHLGYLFGFMAIKGDEFPEGDPRREYKYRAVFHANDIKDQSWEATLFQEMASTPTTLEAAKYCHFFGTLRE